MWDTSGIKVNVYECVNINKYRLGVILFHIVELKKIKQ